MDQNEQSEPGRTDQNEQSEPDQNKQMEERSDVEPISKNHSSRTSKLKNTCSSSKSSSSKDVFNLSSLIQQPELPQRVKGTLMLKV
ncbi:34185_t:CDS:2, partial [Gigaspora margarita]